VSWIPQPEPVARAYRRIAPELGVDPRANETAIRIALREADHLADDIYDVPAALLFTFGRTPRCFAAFRVMSVLVVEWHAKTLGFKLEATTTELAEVLEKVHARALAYEDVKAWIGARLLAYGG
jgi:hypothetical protein